ENRLLRKEEFDDDGADAGEMGAGQTVTAFYELVPARGGRGAGAATAPAGLRYQASAAVTEAARGGELMTLKVRYKLPGESQSALGSWPIRDGGGGGLEGAVGGLRFASG